MHRTMHWTGLLLMASLMTGCAHSYDVCDEHMLKWKCCHEAKLAWLRCRDLYTEVCYPHDFGRGFRAGYESVCMGGDGCPPAMPPRHYWSTFHHHDDGHCRTMAWYDGFHHGVLAAQCDGCEGRCNILCASDLYGQSPVEVDYNDIQIQTHPEQNYAPDFAPAEMPYDTMYPPPAPAVPEYYTDPHSAGTVPGAFEGNTPVAAPVIPGLQEMLEQSAEANAYPTF